MTKIKNIQIRKILNSGGKEAIEAKVILPKNTIGIASSPKAIIPGLREANITNFNSFNEELYKDLLSEIYKTKFINQQKLDNILNNHLDTVGSDICLSISLAFARAYANYNKVSLIEYIEYLLDSKSNYQAPYPLIAIFSGGVHAKNNNGSLQQIMLAVNTNNFNEAINCILTIYNDIENQLKDYNYIYELGASSGFVVKDMQIEEQLQMLHNTILKLGYNNVSIAIDVAAEHLINNDYYLYQNKEYTNTDFATLIQNYKEKYNITFIEDPFDSKASNDWINFKNKNSDIAIVGDDLFATQEKYIDNNLANTIIIKMNQTGTLTNTLNTIKEAKKQKMKLCVSHRSYETEDTFMCDLAVATNSEYIKIGGPRRGDRISKYNRLLDITKNTHN